MKRAITLASIFVFSRTAADARASEIDTPATAVPAAAHIFATAVPADENALTEAPAVTFATWRGTSFGAILPPEDLDVDDTGGFDVAFHFHAAMMAERDWRASTANVVVASATYGIGSGAYADAFASPARFGQMLREISSLVAARPKLAGRALHVRRVTLVAWSAGFAAVNAILAIPDNYALVDSVVLLDGLHATYNHPANGTGQGESQVRTASLATFTRFANDALAGKKTFVLTHSSIVPPGYASTTECVGSLLHGVGKAWDEQNPNPGERTSLTRRFDERGLHARGFTGTSQPAHIDHLHMVGSMMKSYVVPERAKRAEKPPIGDGLAANR